MEKIYSGLVFITLILLISKLTIAINMSWWIVVLPLLFPLIVGLLLAIIIIITIILYIIACGIINLLKSCEH